MNHATYRHFKELFVEIVQTQPALIQAAGNGEPAGKRLAEMAWGFIDECNRQYQQKVKSSAE